MEKSNPYWGDDQERVYAEAALIVFIARVTQRPLDPETLVESLSPHARGWAEGLPAAQQQTFRDTLLGNLYQDEIIRYDHREHQYNLATLGHHLVRKFFEEWQGGST
jgi:hypothetical protein